MLRQRPCHIIEGKADIPWRVDLTRMACMVHLMAAVAQPQSDVFRLLHDMGGPLVIQDMIRLIIGQNRLLDIHTPQLRLRGKEQILDEILLHVHILVIELPQIVLVDVSSRPHQRKLDEPRHRRRHHKLAHTVVIGVHQKRLFAQVVQQPLRLKLRRLPDLRRLLHSKRTYRQERHPLRLFLRIQDLQYLI